MWLKLVPSVTCRHWPINLQESLTLNDENKWMTSILIFSGCEVTNENEMCELQTIQSHCSWAWGHLALTVVLNLSVIGLFWEKELSKTEPRSKNKQYLSLLWPTLILCYRYICWEQYLVKKWELNESDINNWTILISLSSIMDIMDYCTVGNTCCALVHVLMICSAWVVFIDTECLYDLSLLMLGVRTPSCCYC